MKQNSLHQKQERCCLTIVLESKDYGGVGGHAISPVLMVYKVLPCTA